MYKVRADCDLNGTDLPRSERREFSRALAMALRASGREVEMAGSLATGKVAVWVLVEAQDPVVAAETAQRALDDAAAEAGAVVGGRRREQLLMRGVEALRQVPC